MRKITPEIEQFIYDNCSLSGDALSGLIKQNFDLVVTRKAIDPYLKRSRSDKAANNGAKIEAVRSKILDDADKWANKYLRYVDDEIESLRTLIKASEEREEPIELESARDRMAASAALHKMLATIVDFVKPEVTPDVNININQDLSKLSTEDIRVLRAIKSKLGGDRPGTGET